VAEVELGQPELVAVLERGEESGNLQLSEVERFGRPSRELAM